MNQQAVAAALIALVSACGFATANALQHRAAGAVSRGESRALGVLSQLVRRPAWVAGTAVSFVSMLLHAAALRWGSIAFVQPLMLVGLVLAFPVRAALERTWPQGPELRAVAITVAGLATLLSGVALAPGHAAPRRDVALALTAAGLLVAVTASAVNRRWGRGRDRLLAGLLGVAAGCLFGVSAGLLKLVGADLGRPRVPVHLLVLIVLGLVVVGVLGTAINQRAYQIAPLAFSMPLVNVVLVVVAVAFGAVVFGEVPGHSWGHLAVQLLGLGALAIGLREIARLAPDPQGSRPGQARVAGAVR